MNQKGFAHLLPVLLIAAIVLVGVFIVLSNKITLPPSIDTALRPFNIGQKSTAPQAQYQNPLDTKSQYTNPFSSYKNPFEALK